VEQLECKKEGPLSPLLNNGGVDIENVLHTISNHNLEDAMELGLLLFVESGHYDLAPV